MRTRAIVTCIALTACGESGSRPDPDAPNPCGAPLPEETITNLTHSAFAIPSVEMQPGTQRQITLGTVELGGMFDKVDACAAWSIVPATGASVDATGLVTIDAATGPNSRFTVTANVEMGRKLVTAEVFVFRESDVPWRGTWREDKQLACGTGAEVDPEQKLNEILFWADGTLWVTWFPFELYKDYVGTYAFDTGAGTLAIASTGGNYVPPDIDGTGTFTLDTTLTLRDLWLGSPQGSTRPANCGHKLVR